MYCQEGLPAQWYCNYATLNKGFCWLRLTDSNRGPMEYESIALPLRQTATDFPIACLAGPGRLPSPPRAAGSFERAYYPGTRCLGKRA